MSWQTEMVGLLRNLIGDVAYPPTYSDDRLEKVLLTSAQFVAMEVPFTADYVSDIDNGTLTPDPTDRDADTRDDSFINLTVLKAACMISTSEARVAVGQAISIRDGSSAISISADGRLRMWEKGFCSQYEKLRDEFLLTGMTNGPGAIITGPIYETGLFGYYGTRSDGRYR